MSSQTLKLSSTLKDKAKRDPVISEKMIVTVSKFNQAVITFILLFMALVQFNKKPYFLPRVEKSRFPTNLSSMLISTDLDSPLKVK